MRIFGELPFNVGARGVEQGSKCVVIGMRDGIRDNTNYREIQLEAINAEGDRPLRRRVQAILHAEHVW